MSKEFSKRRLKSLRKFPERDYLKTKELRKKIQEEKATRRKQTRLKSRRQLIDELLKEGLDDDR